MRRHDGPGTLPDPAFRRQREEQLHCLARTPTHRPEEGRASRFSTRSSSSPTAAYSTSRSATPSSSSPRSSSTVGPSPSSSGDLRKFLAERQEDHHHDRAEVPVHSRRDRQTNTAGRTFAIIIDEAHSSQGGRTAAKMNMALSAKARRRGRGDDRGHRSTASWNRARCFQTRATSRSPQRPRTRRWKCSASLCRKATRSSIGPFHSYTMKQAIQEGFILDVLQELHARRQLLPPDQEDRGRSGVRHEEGAEEAPAATWNRTSTRFGRKPRSWSTTSMSR